MLEAFAAASQAAPTVAQAASRWHLSDIKDVLTVVDAIKDAVTVVVAIVALVFSILAYRVNAVLARQPVLVFVYESATGWALQNVGSGAAMDVTVLQGKRPIPEIRESLSLRQQIDQEDWFNPVRLPPLAKDGKFDLAYLNHVNDTALGVTYRDTDGRKYTTKCSRELNEFFREEPLKFPNEPITPHWDNPQVHHLPPAQRPKK